MGLIHPILGIREIKVGNNPPLSISRYLKNNEAQELMESAERRFVDGKGKWMIYQQTSSKAEDLEGPFIMLARLVLARMEQWHLSGQVALNMHLKYWFDETGYYDEFETTETYLWLFTIQYLDSILRMEEANLCARKHWEDGIFHYPHHLRGDDGKLFTSESYEFEQVKGRIVLQLLFVVDDVSKSYRTFHPSEGQIIERYRYFRDMWTAPGVRYEVTFPLLHFTSDLRRASKIGDHLYLAPFTPEEKDVVWNQGVYRDSALDNPLSPGIFAQTKFRLTGSHYQKKEIETRDTQEIAHELRSIITALRLFGGGAVGAPALFERRYIYSWHEIESYNREMNLEDRLNDYRVSWLSTSLKGIYHLRATDLPQVKVLYDALHRLSARASSDGKHTPYGDLTIAFRRFNQAYGRSIREDQFIDLTIALESSLLAGDLNHTKKYKLARRGAILLADIREQSETQALLLRIYDARNSIVHGGKLLTELGKDPTKFLQGCENVVRDILKQYVIRIANESRQTLQDVNAVLDRLS